MKRLQINIETDSKFYPEGEKNPRIDGFDENKDKVVNPDELVTGEKEIEIVFDYPLSQEAVLKFKSENGFTRKDFLVAVRDGYRQIYREEDEVCGETGSVPGLLNRDKSNGPHGIWGHVIGDLFFEGYQQVGPAKFTLVIGS